VSMQAPPIVRPDLLPEDPPEGLEILQLTNESLPSCHIYMEAQIFTPDSKRFILHRSSHPHGSDPKDPEHRYLICDLEDGCSLTPITDELGTTGPSLSPDGERLYYFVNETELGAGGRLSLKRVDLDGTNRETMMVIDDRIPGSSYRPSRIYPLSTISSDERCVAISCFLGDGERDYSPFGLLVFDLAKDEVRLILQGLSWCNAHPQYCRSTDPDACRDLLVQENHGDLRDRLGVALWEKGTWSKLGTDIHVVRDDGNEFRDLPWGRDGNEHVQGHQCWRGRGDSAITSTNTRDPRSSRLIEGKAAVHYDHAGAETPGGWRNDLTRNVERPDYHHFATDIEGRLLMADSGPRDEGGTVWLADLPEVEGGAITNLRKMAKPGSSWQKGSHIHPFLSPDGKIAFFNSDESGVLQAYMVRMGVGK
jgi:hypothetical protein